MSKSTTANEKAIAALRKAEQSPAWNRASAYVIIAPNPITRDGGVTRVLYGKIKVYYPKDGMGALRAFVWDCVGNDLQMGAADGCGYDKLSAALDGLKFDGITFSDHPKNWQMQLHELGYTVIQAI